MAFAIFGRFGRKRWFSQDGTQLTLSSDSWPGSFANFASFAIVLNDKERRGCVCLGRGVLIATPALPTKPEGGLPRLASSVRKNPNRKKSKQRRVKTKRDKDEL